MPAMSDDTEDKVPDLSAGQKMISAISGSFLSSLLVTPFDVVRIRLQSQIPPYSSNAKNYAHAQLSSSSPMLPDVRLRSCCREVFFANNNAEYCLASPRGGELIHPIEEAECVFKGLQKNSFNSTFDGLKKIARHEGLTTLWRGLFPTLVMGIPANIIYFTGYDWLRFDDNSPVRKIIPEAWAPLVSGSSARILAGTAVSPIEMLRTRMQAASVGENHFSRTVEGIQKIIADNGYSYLWRGLTLTLWRDVPFSGIYWTGYEFLTKKFTKLRSERLVAHKQACRTNALVNEKISRENEAVKFTDSFLSGALSGAFASFLTMPFDVGKTRRQVFVGKEDLMNRRYNLAAPEERPMIRFLWHIFQEEGLSGLWRGWIPRALKVAPACAIMISSYEIGKQSFYRMNENSLQKRAL